MQRYPHRLRTSYRTHIKNQYERMTEDKLDFWGGFCILMCALAWGNLGPFWGTVVLSAPFFIIAGYDAGDFWEWIVCIIMGPLIYGWCIEWIYLNHLV